MATQNIAVQFELDLQNGLTDLFAHNLNVDKYVKGTDPEDPETTKEYNDLVPSAARLARVIRLSLIHI